jgi:lipopolysaccharide transport system permease protein
MNLTVDNFWKGYGLFIELTKRAFLERYQGSVIGIGWSFIQPIFLLIVYTIVFAVILKTRWGFEGNTIDFVFLLFSGLIVFNAFSECLIRSPSLITSSPNLTKKVVFPLGILSVVSTSVALIHMVIGFSVWLVGYFIIYDTIHITALMLPLFIICITPLLLGLGWFFSAIGVFFKDIGQITGVASQAFLFLTPIFYSIDAVPSSLRGILQLNPLTYLVDQVRLVLFYGFMPSLKNIMIYFILSSLFALVSYLIFYWLKPYFSEEI